MHRVSPHYPGRPVSGIEKTRNFIRDIPHVPSSTRLTAGCLLGEKLDVEADRPHEKVDVAQFVTGHFRR
jgi:hypothetical protein